MGSRSDNWMYLIIDDATKQAAAVDPWEAEKVSKGAKAEGVQVGFGAAVLSA